MAVIPFLGVFCSLSRFWVVSLKGGRLDRQIRVLGGSQVRVLGGSTKEAAPSHRGEQGARSLLLLLLKHFLSAKLVFHSIKWNLHLRWASNQCFTNPAAALHFAELAQIMGRVPAGSSQFNPGRPVPT